MGAAFPSPPVRCYGSLSRPTHFRPGAEHGHQCTKGAVTTFPRPVGQPCHKQWVSIPAHSDKAAKRKISRRSQAPTNLELETKIMQFCLNHRQSTKYLSTGFSFFKVLTLVSVRAGNSCWLCCFCVPCSRGACPSQMALSWREGTGQAVTRPLTSLATVSENKI